MNKNIILTIVLILISFNSFGAKINSITISGNSRIEQKTIEQYLDVKIGSNFNELVDKKILSNLYGTGLFNNIKLHFFKGNLDIKVEEKIFINQVIFKGNVKIKKDIFKQYIKTTFGKSLDESLVQKDVEIIKEIYKKSGKYNALITSKIEILKNNVAKVIFEIDEGPKTSIKQIYFAGNSNFSSETLKSIILTRS